MRLGEFFRDSLNHKTRVGLQREGAIPESSLPIRLYNLSLQLRWNNALEGWVGRCDRSVERQGELIQHTEQLLKACERIGLDEVERILSRKRLPRDLLCLIIGRLLRLIGLQPLNRATLAKTNRCAIARQLSGGISQTQRNHACAEISDSHPPTRYRVPRLHRTCGRR